MSKTQNTPIHKKSQSTQHSNTNRIKKASILEHELDRGKRALKKLIPNQPMVLIKKLVQKGAAGIKREIMNNQRLLPSLTLKSMQAEIFEKMIPQSNSFQQMNQKLTHSMLFFEQNTCTEAEQGEILRMQTEKCYRKIPKFFFDEYLSSNDLGRLLTRDKREAMDSRDQLGDYYDQVQFNVNQQVGYKMKVFMTFVTFLTSIGNLADLSIMKIKGTRIKNQMIKEIVVQRSERVNVLRSRKQQIQISLTILNQLKKLKKLENMLMSQVQAKGKITMASDYQDYCEVHEAIKEYCCSRMICRYWDVSYYMERGYQDSFSRSVKNYIREIILLEEEQIRNILHPKKQDYVTVTPIRSIDDPAINLDESYEIDDADIELVTKNNIEREIVSLFKQGLHKCTYSTDQICQQIRMAICQCQKKLYSIIKGDQTIILSNQSLSQAEKKSILDKLPLSKYVRIVQQWSSRMKKIVRREASVIERALSATIDLRRDFPEKEEVISSYLMQILYITFLEIDESMASFIKSRKFKLHEADPIRQLLTCSQQWKDFILDFKNFPSIWNQLKLHFACEKQNTQSRIIEGLLTNFLSSRRKIVDLMIDVYNKASVQGLPVKLQEDEWKTISLPNRYYNTLGQIIYGSSFSKHIQSLERKLLSSSLLLERNSSLFASNDHQGRRQSQLRRENVGSNQEMQFDLQVGENSVTLVGQSFKIISSSLCMIDFLHGYLEWVQEAGEGELLEHTILGKVMQFVIMYNENVKKLILGKQALNYGKIKSKSITAKHLVIAYSQLKFFKVLTQAIAKRFPSFKYQIVHVLLDKNMGEITKKFRTILQLAINESINRIVVDPRKPIIGPVQQTVEIVTAVNRSSQYVKDILMSPKEMGQFIGGQWCFRYIQQVKSQYKSVYKSIMNSNGTRKSKDIDWTDNIYWKFKQLEYMVQNLQEFKSYLPGMEVIVGELQSERKKLQHPQ